MNLNWFTNGNIFQEVSLSDLIDAIKSNSLRLPIFQRDAVWSEGRICSLWDSILRGYPLPSLLVTNSGKLSRRFQAFKNDARGHSIEKEVEEKCFDLLDGQQRLCAIDAGFSFDENSSIRIWVDVGNVGKSHPYKNKFWLHACTRIFPFGFSTQPAGEYDFAVLSDHKLDDIWNNVHELFEQKGKREYYEYPLDQTFPESAICPVPLDKLIKHKEDNTASIISLINELISEVSDRASQYKLLRGEANQDVVKNLAISISKLNNYHLALQLVSIDDHSEDDEYNLYERIGRGGMQISQRQLAVAKIMMTLGKEGNDAIAKFSKSPKLRNMLETEDVIHGLARVAYAVCADKACYDVSESNEEILNNDLIEMTPARLKVIEKDSAKWNSIKDIMKQYCQGEQESMLQLAFERMYENISYRKDDNPNGFSKAQLAQPDKNADDDGIVPISLHPLLYWHITHTETKPDINDRNDMIRWILFANGFIKKPKHIKLNRIVFSLTVANKKVDFPKILEVIYNNENKQLRGELGLIQSKPSINPENVKLQSTTDEDHLLRPTEVTELFKLNALLQNWINNNIINWFILLWNQREVISRLYDDISYVPALYSKGRPFDLDHIVARKRLVGYGNAFIDDEKVKIALFKYLKEIMPEATDKDFRLTADSYRKNLSYSIANYRYWPRKLNRSDQDIIVKDKMKIDNIKKTLKGTTMSSKFDAVNDDKLWEWCSIPVDRKNVWGNLPPENPENWDTSAIRSFFEEISIRHEYLYKNVYEFLLHSTNTYTGYLI